MTRWALILMGLGALAGAPSTAWADPAQLGSWLKGCQANQTTKSLDGAEWACYRLPALSDDESASPVISVAACENFDIFMHDDPEGGGAAVCTVTWDIEMCPVGVASTTLPDGTTAATDAIRNAACTDLPGTNDLSGDDVESNLAGMDIRVHGMNAGANIQNCEIVLKCAVTGK